MKLLASVRDAAEARIVVEGGADIVDLKDPDKGALGAVSPQVLAEVIAAVGGERPVSAVAGDLPMESEAVLSAVDGLKAAHFVKVGLFPATRAARLAVVEALAPAARQTRLVAVLFADGAFDPTLLPDLAKAGFAGAMIDTIGKGRGDDGRPRGLLAHLALPELAAFVEEARALGLMTGLAGSLEAPDVSRLSAAAPDYLGFRGALTAGGRADPVSLAAVRGLRRILDQAQDAARPAAASIASQDGDLVFVRDMVVPMEIGAYGHERGRRQDVRFGVEARIEPLGADPRGMADIYSYDIIMDAVRLVTARGHVELVETLAVDLAERLLCDGRVRAVTVRVEKLALGPGAVGIEIERRRAAS
ncbi:(5-formylfuran-3-yl)methyl phosphate synthase [Aurantimonas sp. Leaf443]|uniref:(5-formylfuran-3-yl)methyl phosphate synthase n=1 Tax=Aurantimonas sp. Leaf443 TaxID=1736378 RepID=UPI0009EAED71|nr:(5-formylfuran-3-yl)methyl phosphate synthase [Aurantimonas sp. Leaf443]